MIEGVIGPQINPNPTRTTPSEKNLSIETFYPWMPVSLGVSGHFCGWRFASRPSITLTCFFPFSSFSGLSSHNARANKQGHINCHPVIVD